MLFTPLVVNGNPTGNREQRNIFVDFEDHSYAPIAYAKSRCQTPEVINPFSM